MIKLKTMVIVILVYFISFISLRFNINFLYPYYYIKDIILSPVRAISSEKEIEISNDFKDSLITSLKDEIAELKNLTNVKMVLGEFNHINATIIERNREYWFNSFTINKGSIDNIKEDMAVIDSNGLIGRISSVNKYTSTVKLITTNDTKNKISAVIRSDIDVYGILSGYDNNRHLLKVVITKNNEKINNGMKVETTGMGGIFPSGILIGNVASVIRDGDGVTTIVYVKPSGNLEGEKYVSILQRKEESNN